MIGMVLVTHGLLATEFKAALEHVVGPQEQLETITIGPEDDMEVRRKDIMSAVCRVNSGEGVVVLTDMFGGTPSNLALSCMNGGSVEVVAGINLPLLQLLNATGQLTRGQIPTGHSVTVAAVNNAVDLTPLTRIS